MLLLLHAVNRDMIASCTLGMLHAVNRDMIAFCFDDVACGE